VACTTGVFHPKITALFGDSDAHLLVGSGNLTFGGWGMNLETVEHLHPSFSAEVFDDAADMFELMSIAETIRCGIGDNLEPLASDLRRSAIGAPRKGGHRLLHSIGGSIGAQVAGIADELGGATRLTVVSPYFDAKGSGLKALARRLGCEDVRLHVHEAGPVRGLMGTNWPAGTSAQPVVIEGAFGSDDRKLHAKCFEILCRRGRIVLSGSANATHAGLFSGNVEASLARIQRETLVGWNCQVTTPPPVLPMPEDGEDGNDAATVGILRATLEGDRLVGEIIASPICGAAKGCISRASGMIDLGLISVDDKGHFTVAAPSLEFESWGGGRMVLRLEQSGISAEGFISIAAAARIIATAGALAPRLLAMLSGTETPEDVAIILSWYREDPTRMMPAAIAAGSGGDKRDRASTWVPLDELEVHGATCQGDVPGASEGEPGWQRALSLVRSAFTERRGPWNAGTDEDESADDEQGRESEPARDRRLRREETARQAAIRALDDLLDEMLAERHGGIHAASAFALTHYLCDRARPAPVTVRLWLTRIIADFPKESIDTAVATAALLLIATDEQDRSAARARRFLLRAGHVPGRFDADCEAIRPFIDILSPSWHPAVLLEEITRTRTAGEEIEAYLEAIRSRAPLPSLPGLEGSAHWSNLLHAAKHPDPMSRLLLVGSGGQACPRCHLVLPTGAQEELARFGVTTHCRLILRRGL
jgi:hypothetical protein